jgi:hypothetical protein
MKIPKILWIAAGVLLVVVVIVAVGLGLKQADNQVSSTPTTDSDAVLTGIVQTAETMRQATTSAIAAQASPTLSESTFTPTLSASATITSTTSTPYPTAPLGGLRVVFVADVTIPDGTIFAPNTFFTKTWRIRNGGTVTWTTAYSLAYQSGNQMGGPSQVPLTQDVPPNGEIEISVNMVAPATAGRYISNWLMRDPNGKLFGIDPEAKYPIYVDITVSESGGTVLPTATGGLTTGTPSGTSTVAPTVTVTPSGVVAGATISVDNATASGCPHTFTFTVQFTLIQAATVSYRLEAGASDPNVTINLPPSVTTSLEAGTHTLIYSLDFTTAVEGWAQFHITTPQDLLSNRVSYTLTCNP